MESFIDKDWLQQVHQQTISAYNRSDWRKVPIKECGEPLVEVPPELKHAYYAEKMRLITDERQFLRERVLESFYRARELLNGIGYDLKVYDGWRSVQLQELLFWMYLRDFTAASLGIGEKFTGLTTEDVKRRYMDLSDKQRARLKKANCIYCSWPSKNPDSPSPHATGGAVDVWLYKDGEPVNLGVPFDWMKKNAGAFYHMQTNASEFNGSSTTVVRNRELLLTAMTRVGFGCYEPEIWHYNLGNQMGALVQGTNAIYSYIEP